MTRAQGHMLIVLAMLAVAALALPLLPRRDFPTAQPADTFEWHYTSKLCTSLHVVHAEAQRLHNTGWEILWPPLRADDGSYHLVCRIKIKK